MKKYIISLKNIENKEQFCNEMDKSQSTPKGFIPQRSCDYVSKRPMSRNAVYYLSEEEANQIKNDVRIKNVQLSPDEIPGLEVRNCIFDPNIREKIRGIENDKRDFSKISIQAAGDKFATISNLPNAINVDIVVVDDYVEANHPELAVNPNGTGGSRVKRINWYDFDPQVLGYYTGNSYNYTINNNKSHGTHVAGTAAGNTHGWAKKANIYHIRFPGAAFGESDRWTDYIRAFHNNKILNGIKNPTIVNNSWGYMWNFTNQSINNISTIFYRGLTIPRPTGGWNRSFLAQRGIVTQNTGNLFVYNSDETFENIEVTDMVNEGIIVVAAAANNYTKCDVIGGVDYNNYFIINYNGNANQQYLIYYNRGSSPGSSVDSICVGAIDWQTEYKDDYSNCGPAVDVYAPGSEIASSVLIGEPGSIADPRSSGYGLAKFSGTSMASPQVAGMLACVAANNSLLNQTTARNYISSNSKNTVADTFGDQGDFSSLQGSPNRYLYYSGANVSYP